jgi:transposase
MVEGTTNTDAVVAMLDEFVTGLTRKTVVVLDNAPIHRSRKFQAKITSWARRNLLIYFLPPYSPELNLIEILWKHIKHFWLPFDAFLNFQNLKERLSQILSQIGSKWIINF